MYMYLHVHVHVNVYLALMFSGRHCCFYCEISSEEMRIPLEDGGRRSSRSLHSLQQDYLDLELAQEAHRQEEYVNTLNSACT